MNRDALVMPLTLMLPIPSCSQTKANLAVRQHSGTDNSQVLFWSPDSRSIAFWDGRQLRRAGVTDASVGVIGEADAPGTYRCLGGTWRRNGSILVALVPGGIFFVASSGGRFEPVLRPEVFVQPFPSGPGRWTVSVEGGDSPRWSPKGDELFFLSGNTLMVSSTETAGTFRATRPAPLIDGDSAGVWFYSFTPQIPSYDVGLDGRTFVVVRPSGGGENEIMLIQNWSVPFTK